MKPVQPAVRSMAAALQAPSLSCTMQAVAGKPTKSGVAVATTIISSSAGCIWARCRALRAASTARSEVAWSSAARCRLRMPVWDTIHSSEVSRCLGSSLLDIRRTGT